MNTLHIAYIGGFGLMAAPSARHLKNNKQIRVTAVHDRGTQSERHEVTRELWKEAGATLCSTLEETINKDEVDFLFVCCGKNGDDQSIIREAVSHLSKQTARTPCIIHASTVSAKFTREAKRFANAQNVSYVNYPLTGGPKGAEAASMLLLCSGPKEIYQKALPFLSQIGDPKFFSTQTESGAEVKLIGQLMVFNNLLGLSSAVALQSECLEDGAIGNQSQVDFFEFLNNGAGGSRQWPVAMQAGVALDIWDSGFLIKHALVDALYAAELLLERKLGLVPTLPIFLAALSFLYTYKKQKNLATHAIVKELLACEREAFDTFVAPFVFGKKSAEEIMDGIVENLPQELTCSLALDISF